MNKVMNISVRRRRTALLGGVALGLILPVGAAIAQTGPVVGTVPELRIPATSGNPGTTGGATVTTVATTSGNAMSVNLNDANRVIEWNSFSVSNGSSVAFNTANTATNFTVLNRVTGGTMSEIYGQVTSQANIAVWLSNPNGIMYGASGTFSGGSLVLTTAALNGFSATDPSTFPTSGTVRLGGMGSAAINIASRPTNGSIAGLDVTGSLIVAAQQIAVTGRISATGDVALVAARSVDVPVALGSNVRVTINEGTTVAEGRVVVGANGTIDARRGLALAGAAGNATTFLLGIDPTAKLSAMVDGGRVILAAGTGSTEAAAGSNMVTVNPDASGVAAIAAARTTITSGETPGTIAAGAIDVAATGDISLLNAMTATNGLTVSSNGGALSLAGNLTSTAGDVVLTGRTVVQLGASGQTRALLAGRSVQIRSVTQGVTSNGTYAIESGRANDTGGVSIRIGGGAGFALAGTSIRAGTEAAAGTGYRGSVSLLSNSATPVPLTLEAVDAADLAINGVVGPVSIGRLGLVGDVALDAAGSLRLDSATSLNGSIGLRATGDISGRAGAGGLLAGFGRTTLTAGATGRTISVVAGGTAQLGDLGAGTIGTGTSLGARQLSVDATAIDLLTARVATGNLLLTATGAGATGTIRAATLAAPLGDIALTANGEIRGQVAPSALNIGIRIGTTRTTTLDIATGSDVRLGTLDAGANLAVDAGGSVTGLLLAGDIAAGPGVDITEGGTLTIGTASAPAARVALGTVNLGATGGAVRIDGSDISVGAIDTAGTVTLRAANGLSIDALGAAAPTGAVVVRGGLGVGVSPLWSTTGLLDPLYGGAILRAAGAVRVGAGQIAQLSRAEGASVSIAAEAVTVDTAIARTGALGILARGGGLYLGTGFAGDTATLTKQGNAGPTDADELRITSALAAVGNVTVRSATDIRATQVTTSSGNAVIDANGAVSGLRRAAPSFDGRLAADYDRADVAADAANATVQVDARNGIAQLGYAIAGDAAGGVDAQANQLRVNGVGVDISEAAARNGNLALTAGAAGLRLGTGSAAWGATVHDSATGTYSAGIVSAADAQIGTLTADRGDILIRVPGTLTGIRSAGEAVAAVGDGLSVGNADVGSLSMIGTGEVTLGDARVGRIGIDALGSVRIGRIAATGAVDVTAARSITGLGTLSGAAPGANLIATVGSVRFPSPDGASAPTVAILGEVQAGTDVALRAQSLSAQSILAVGNADVQAGNLSIGSLTAATAALAAGGSIVPDDGALTVDANGALRAGYGFADISTSGVGAAIVLTAVDAVQAGTIAAGDGSTLVSNVAGDNAQVRINAAAITARSVTAANGSMRLSAGAGDLYLGAPTLIDAASATTVATARDRAVLTKNGSAGLVTIAGGLQAGAGGTAGSGTGDDGLAELTSATDIRARRIASVTGDVRLTASGFIGGIATINAGNGGPLPVFARAGEVVLSTIGAGGTVSANAGDIRIGSARSATAIDLTAAGSVTGLAIASSGPATGYQVLAIDADRNVTIGGLVGDPLDIAAIGSIGAGGDVTVAAGAISIGSIDGDGSALLTGEGIRLDNATLVGGLTAIGGTTIGSDPPALFAADLWDNGSETLASGYGAANLAVTAAGAASGAVGTITVNAGLVAQLGAVAAGSGTAAMRDADGNPRDQLTVNASAITLASGTATNGAVRLIAANGGLYAGAIAAGTTAVLAKQGTPGTTADGDELRIGTLSAGTTGAVGVARGDVTLSSSAAARLGTISTATGSTRIGSETMAGATTVTGLLREAAASGEDGQALPAYGGANLSAASPAVLTGEPIQRVVVHTSGAAKLGNVMAGVGTTLATDDQAQVWVRADALDIDQVAANNGNLMLTTDTGRLRLGTGMAAGNADLTAGSAAAAAAEITSLTAIAGNLTVKATNGVTGWLGAGVALVGAADGLQMGTVVSGRDVTITAAGNARLDDVTATGALVVGAAGSVTGLRGNPGSAANAVTLLKAGGNVTVGAVADGGSLALANIGQVDAGGSARVTAGSIAIGGIRSGSTTTLMAGTGLAVGMIDAGGAVVATTSATGASDVDNAVLASGGVLAEGYGAANLTARTVGTVPGTISVRAGDVAQLGTLIAGTATTDPLLATPQISVMARAMRIESATAFGGAIDLTASAGDLGLQTAQSGSWLRLRKMSAQGVAYVGSLVSGTQAGSDGVTPTGAGGTLGFRGGTTLIDSSTAIRGGAIASRTGDILLRAVDGVTGRGGMAGTAADFVIGTIDAGTATLFSAGTMRIKQATAAGALNASANGSITGLADGVAAGGSGMTLTAARGVDVRGSGTAALVGAALGDVTAKGRATLEDGTQLADTVRIAAGQITGGRIDAGTGAVTLSAGRAIDVGAIIAGSLSATTSASNGATDTLVAGVGDTTAGFDEERLAAGFGDAQMLAGGTLDVTSRTGVAQLGRATGSEVKIAAEAITLRSRDLAAGRALTATRDATLTARSGALYLESATVTGRATLTKTGTASEMRVGTLGASSVALDSDTAIRLESATATGRRSDGIAEITLRAGTGAITGLNAVAGGTPPFAATPADGRVDDSYGRANLTASANGARIEVTAAGLAQLGTVTAAGMGGDTNAQITVSAGAIDVVSATASNGAMALSATQGALWLGSGSASTGATLTKAGATGKMRIGTGGLGAGGNVTIASSTDLDVLGAVRSNAKAGVLRITNTGGNATLLGGAATATDNSAFTLNADEVNRLGAATVIVDSRANAVTIGALAIGSNAANDVANTNLRLLGTGAFQVTGAVKGTGTGRTLQIGGTDADLPIGKDLATPANLAASISVRLPPTGGGSIDWAGGMLALAGQRIVAGDASLQGAVAGASVGGISRLVSDPSSALYRGSGSNAPYLTAGSLSVTYRDYALFQNSGSGSAVTAGAALGSGAAPNALALRVTALGDNGSDSFALFGAINGFVSSAAALQPETVIDFAGGSPRVVRITLANARINGCGIGVATAGCLAGTPPPPALSLFDERQIQLFGTDSNPELQFEPLIGTNNEGLVGDLATAGVEAECITGPDTVCPAPRQEVKP